MTDFNGPHFIAWVDPGDTVFDPARHARVDEEVFSIAFTLNEGDIPSLQCDIKNPRVGLLSPLRKQWAWFSWYNGTTIVPIMFGRLNGVPADFTNEIITLEFLARPTDFVDQKAAIALTLQILPFFDPIFIDITAASDPDTVLEGYPLAWCVDPVSHEVSVSNITQGEDGTVDVDEKHHFYNDTSVSYGDVPLTDVAVNATITWNQSGQGDIDFTRALIEAYKKHGGNYDIGPKLIGSLSADGLQASWPKPGDSFGQGWTAGASTGAVSATWITNGTLTASDIIALQEKLYPSYSGPNLRAITAGASRYGFDVEFVDQSPTNAAGFPEPFVPQSFALKMVNTLWESFLAYYPLGVLQVNLSAHYEASRSRTEIVQFVVSADVQSTLTDPEDAATQTITVSSSAVDQPLDATDSGSSSVPIGDSRRSSYLKTDRGNLSLQYLINLARVQILARARCVSITFGMEWKDAIGVFNLRKSIRLFDRRLPGGVAIGKITQVVLSADDSSGETAKVTIGCTVGHGGTLIDIPGTPVYAFAGYCQPGYQKISGRFRDLLPDSPGLIQYEDLADFEIDDDGLDLFNMNDSIVSFDIENGPDDQAQAITDSLNVYAPDPSGALRANPTKITINLPGITGASFQTVFTPQVALMKVPKTIDLEAAT